MLTNWSHSLDYFGYTWTGLGSDIGVSVVTHSEELQYLAVDVQLNVAKASMLALALGNATEYRGRPMTIWQGLLDDELKPARGGEGPGAAGAPGAAGRRGRRSGVRLSAAVRREHASVAEAEIMRFAQPDPVTGLRPHALWHKHVHNVELDPVQCLKMVEMDAHRKTADFSCRRTGKTAVKEIYILERLASEWYCGRPP
ncbi:hypothetical protein [Roseateles sp. P5_E1]